MAGSFFKVETLGNWRAIADGEAELYKASQWTSLRDAGDGVKNAGRDAIKNAKLKGAAKLSKTVRGQIFPKKKGSSDPAYVVGRKPSVLDNFEKGGVATSRGRGLLIPINEAAKFKQPAFASAQQRGQRAKAAMEAKYGKLSWRMERGQLFLGYWSSGGKFKALFVLAKTARVPKLVAVEGAILAAGRNLAEHVAQRAMQLFAAGHDAVVSRFTGSKH